MKNDFLDRTYMMDRMIGKVMTDFCKVSNFYNEIFKDS